MSALVRPGLPCRLLLFCLALAPCLAIPTFAAPAEPDYVWLDVSLNGVALGPALAVRDPDGRLWLESRELQGWGLLDHSSQRVRRIEAEDFVDLASIQGLSQELEASAMALNLRIDPRRLPHNHIGGLRRSVDSFAERGSGVLLNYDALVTGSFQDELRQSGVFLEPLLFSPQGNFRTGLRLIHRSDTGRVESLRLDSVFSRDLEAWQSRLELGDFISATDGLDTRYRLAGVQLRRDFAMRPGELTFATPVLVGLAEVPSNVELYIDGVRRAQLTVPPGPFSIDDAPVITGAGTAELVLRNALGEDVRQSIDFFVDPALLRKGLLDYAIGAGWLRERFGLENFDYSQAMAVAQLRYGLNDEANLEWRSALAEDAFNAELRYVFRLLDLPLTVTAGAGAIQASGQGKAASGRFGLNWRQKRFFAGLDALVVDTPPGGIAGLPTSRQILMRAGTSVGGWSVSADSLYRRRQASDRFERQSLRASRSFRLRQGHLSFNAAIFRTEDSLSAPDEGFQIGLSYSPDARQRFSVSQRRDKDRQWVNSYQIRPHDALGHSLLLQHVGDDDNDRMVAQFDSIQSRWQARGRIQSDGDEGFYQLGGAGALGWMGGRPFAVRALGGSFAVVTVDGQADVPVYLHNRIVGRTDSRGLAVVPELTPYQPNPIRIDPLDLPLSQQLPERERIVTPALRTGLMIDFPLGHARGVELSLWQAPGVPVPSGAAIYRDDEDVPRFFVADDGRAYLELDRDENAFTVYWQNQQCRFSVRQIDLPDGLQPDMGARRCF